MPGRVFRDRRDAGRVLATLLGRYRNRGDVIVLALPRGGVAVGYEVATALGVPLDVFLVRKLAETLDALAAHLVIHIDDARALEPLQRTARWERGEVPETFPHAV